MKRKRKVKYSNGWWKDKCDTLWAQIVKDRAGWVCEWCGKDKSQSKMEAAHIIPRGEGITRHDLDNGWCGCYYCHNHRWHSDPLLANEFAIKLKGARTINRLKKLQRDKTMFKINYEDVYNKLLKQQKMIKKETHPFDI
jgi:hypothetical protein